MKVKLSEYRLSKNIQSHSNQIQTKHNQTENLQKSSSKIENKRRMCRIPLCMVANNSGSSIILNERKEAKMDQVQVVAAKYVNFGSLSPHSKQIEPSFKESLTPCSNKNRYAKRLYGTKAHPTGCSVNMKELK